MLVNNAGIGGNGVAEETPIDVYADVMDVNVYGTVRCAQAVLPQMRERGSGCIINVSSIAGVIAAIAQSPYVTSKWALEGLTEGLAQEVAPFGIRVALIEPGIVMTAIMAKNTDAPTPQAPTAPTTGVCSGSMRRVCRPRAGPMRWPRSSTPPPPTTHRSSATRVVGAARS